MAANIRRRRTAAAAPADGSSGEADEVISVRIQFYETLVADFRETASGEV